MKKIIKSLAFLVFLTCGLLSSISLYADPPNPPGGHGSTNNGTPGPIGGPIDGGLGFLLALGGAYGARKIYTVRKERNEGDPGTEGQGDKVTE